MMIGDKLHSVEIQKDGVPLVRGIWTYKIIDGYKPPQGVVFEFETITVRTAIDPDKHFGRSFRVEQIAIPTTKFIRIKNEGISVSF